MKSFEFSLDRIHGYKEQVLSREKLELGVRQGVLNEKIQMLETLKRQKDEENQRYHQLAKEGMTAQQMISHRYLMESMYIQERVGKVERDNAQAFVNQQLMEVVRAKQEVSGFDKLADKEREAHQKEEAKESAQDILEYITLTHGR